MAAPSDRRILGLDEAGRGSVLGPLVVGGFLMDESRLPALAALGVKDSKLLTPQGRNEVFSGLAAIGERVHVKIPPRTVDRWVARNGLNELEAQAFGRLVRTTQPDVTYVDACDPVAWRFGGRVRRWARTDRPIVAQHHADRDLLVVGAASVVAKVHRDRAIASLARRLGQEIGTGYPCDARTIAHVRSVLADGAAPEWVRHSWATTERLKPKLAALALDAFPV
jgi:ribonuclease HII